MNKIIVLFLIVCVPFFAYSQQWHKYSDSVLVNFKKNNFEKAKYFIGIADADLQQSLVLKDTIYADYLYRKGVVKSNQGYYDSSILKESLDVLSESLDIWNSSSKKNFLKIMKINYFIGNNYYLIANKSHNKSDYDATYKFYVQCYNLIKKHHLQSNPIFKTILHSLSFIDFSLNKDLNKAKRFAQEYINYIDEKGIEDFDFDYVNVFGYKQDFISQEKILLRFLKKYEFEKLNNPQLLFNIYLKLFINKKKFKEGIYPKYPNEIIKYGEKAIDICKSNNLKAELELSTIYLGLEIAYGQIKDNVNSEKFRKLNFEYYSKNNEIDYLDIIEKLYIEKDFVNFKIKFDEYEIKFKNDNNFSALINIYRYSLNLYTNNILFNRDDIENQLLFANNNRLLFQDEDIVFLDYCLSEFYIVTGQYEKALNICNQHLDEQDIYRRLKFYQFKHICEIYLGYKTESINTAIKSLDIATKNYGDKDPKLLPILQQLLDLNLIDPNLNSSIIATKALRIIYDNKLDETDIASRFWVALGGESLLKRNFKDAEIYYEKAKKIHENPNRFPNPGNYYLTMLGLSMVKIFEGNFIVAQDYLDKVKIILDNNPIITQFGSGDYYNTLGDFYFFQDKFSEANFNYKKSFSFYGEKLSTKKTFYNILCEYFLENNLTKTIDALDKFQRENSEFIGTLTINYLLRYNARDIVNSKKMLLNLFDKQIYQNNQYFHLLSYDDKNILYENFSRLFEFSNTYLLDTTDSHFLKRYIDYRFYSKSILFSNSIKLNIENENNMELYNEFKSNKIKINTSIEAKNQDSKRIEELKNKNREIEKFLSANTKPLMLATLKDLKNKLLSGEAYVEIIRINKQAKNSVNQGIDIVKMFTDSISYGAIVIKKNKSPKFILIDDSNQLEMLYTQNFKSKIQNKQEDIESYHLLFEKIDNELKDVKKIYLVTDGVYNSINIESIYNPIRKQYLIDYLEIQTVQNIKSIIDKKEDFKFGSNSKAVLLGNPDFDLTLATSNMNDILLERGLDSNMLNDIKNSVKISMLNGTQKEIESINTILQNTNCPVELYTAAQASEDNLKKVNSPYVLHIATHGFFLKNEDTSKTKQSITELINDNYKNDSYLKSGLLLAGAQNTLNGIQLQNSNNGILMAEEAKSLDLRNTELVVLSACETGLGDNLVGQGVLGLQRAFMIAGAKSVVMSLWSVSDEKTQKLMTLFYSNWVNKDMSKNEALHQAKIAMKKLYPEPYYWAGFVLLE